MATYKKGSRSDEVKRIQEALGIEADGIYGSNTERAVRNYQQQNGLKVDGIVGNNTWGSLFGGSSGGWGDDDDDDEKKKRNRPKFHR